MNGLSAVIFVPEDMSKHGYAHPMMLQPVQGAPLLRWLSYSLYENGVERFFLVCRETYMAQARACLPEGVEVMTSADSNPADQLHVFLSTADEGEDEITVVTGPVVYLPHLPRMGTQAASACLISREALMEALDSDAVFSRFLSENCTPLSENEGFYTVDSPAALQHYSRLLQRNRNLALEQQGVEIFDTDNCYVEPQVKVGVGAKLLAGTILRGKTAIGSETIVGPWSEIADSEIGPQCLVQCSLVHNSRIAANIRVGPYSYIQDNCAYK
jgi:NDP-sugar pyrophosphorylase family protein